MIDSKQLIIFMIQVIEFALRTNWHCLTFVNSQPYEPRETNPFMSMKLCGEFIGIRYMPHATIRPTLGWYRNFKRSHILSTAMAVAQHWAIPDKFCNPSIEDFSALNAWSLEFHLLFFKLFLEIQSEKTQNCGFYIFVEFGNLYENNDFCSKNLGIQAYILPKKSGNPTSFVEGRVKFFWNSPFQLYGGIEVRGGGNISIIKHVLLVFPSHVEGNIIMTQHLLSYCLHAFPAIRLFV